ncbi:MAG: permease [Sandaracinaceae bacterium]|nr:permease [Sandaracinaceae bacterium]
MILASAVALASIAAGIALGLGGRRGALGALSTFAIVAALAVVLLQLLPDAIAGAGWPALVVLAAGVALPRLLEAGIVRLAHGARPSIALELSYAALLLHQVGDGLGLGTYASAAHEGHSHFDILLAISAHTVPLVALLTTAYARRASASVAIVRGVGLAVGQLTGVGIAALAPSVAFGAVEPWVTAAIAGLLVHVVTHDWQLERAAPAALSRTLTLAAVGAGTLLALAGGHDHDHGGAAIRARMLDALADLALETAPALLIGLCAVALLSAASGTIAGRWLRGGPALSQAARGALAGAPHAHTGRGVPLADSLRSRGAGPALVVAFLIATPQLGLDTIALTARFLGWPFAVLRATGAIIIAIVTGLAVHAASRARAGDVVEVADAQGSFARRALASFDELVLHVAPWTVLGLVAAAFVHVALPAGSIGGAGFGLDVLIVTLIAVPSYVCASSATPLGAVLLAKGMSSGAVLAGLVLGSAVNMASIGYLRRAYGSRAAWLGVAALVASAWALAALANATVTPAAWTAGLAHAPPSTAVIALASVLGLALIVSLWRHGVGGWLSAIAQGLGAHAAGPHDHGCQGGCADAHEHHLHAGEHPSDSPVSVGIRDGTVR